MAHPIYYTELLRRRFTGDPSLTPAERRELDLHLLMCPECNYDYGQMLLPRAERGPEPAEHLAQALSAALTAELVTPYLPDLARAMRAGQPLTGFQRMLWQYVCGDREAMGRYRMFEAEAVLARR